MRKEEKWWWRMGVCVFFVKIENKWDEKKTEQKTWFYRFRFPDGHAHLLGREEKEREGSLWCMCSEQTLTITMSSFLFYPLSRSFYFYCNATSPPAGTLAQRLVRLYDKSSISHLGASFPMCIHAQRDENITMETKKDT
jgi:hypothetical protein